MVNDRPDIAVAAKADGVHLAANSISSSVVRAAFPPEMIIVVSTHTHAAAKLTSDQGADFAVFAPIFETPGKGEPQGLGRLKEICSELRPFPVLGLGGIDETNYQSVLEAGASGFAAIRILNDPQKLRKLRTNIANSQ